MTAPKWTVGEQERLRQLWERGATAGTIAILLGRTPASITSQRARMGLPGRPSPTTRK